MPRRRPYFRPFIAVYLTERGWSQTEIGVALSIGTASGLVSQLLSGMLVDLVHRKRAALRRWRWCCLAFPRCC